MCNNNLAAPQRELETSIQPLKKPTSLIFIFGRLARSSGTKVPPKNSKNQPRPSLRPISVNFRQHFWNISHKTVPVKVNDVIVAGLIILMRSTQTPTSVDKKAGVYEWNNRIPAVLVWTNKNIGIIYTSTFSDPQQWIINEQRKREPWRISPLFIFWAENTNACFVIPEMRFRLEQIKEEQEMFDSNVLLRSTVYPGMLHFYY
jgi:hypothetical protein